MRLKSLVRYPIDIRRAQRLLALSRTPKSQFSQPPLGLDLTTRQLLFDCGRHLYSIAHAAQKTGSVTYLRCDRVLLSEIARKIHGRDLLAAPFVEWIPREHPLPTGALILADHPQDQAVQMLIGKDRVDSAPVMPYPMHPATLPHAGDEVLERLRQCERSIGILFAGNQKAKYAHPKISAGFGVMNRLQVLEIVRDVCGDLVDPTPLAGNGFQPTVICDTNVHSIPAENWLSTIAAANFFVCCPGASQPLCHHLPEAMSVGTIPLVEFGNRITPALQDGIHCIGYRGRQGLSAAVRHIQQMTTERMEVMRANVIEFYQRNLRLDRFVDRLRGNMAGRSGGKVSMPFHEVNFFDHSSLEDHRNAAA